MLRVRSPHGPWRVLLALLCVLLVGVSATVQVAHTHPNEAVSHPDCSLCATAHVVAQITHSPVPVPVAAVHETLEALPPAIAPTALSTFALFTRPPPAVDIVPA